MYDSRVFVGSDGVIAIIMVEEFRGTIGLVIVDSNKRGNDRIRCSILVTILVIVRYGRWNVIVSLSIDVIIGYELN